MNTIKNSFGQANNNRKEHKTVRTFQEIQNNPTSVKELKESNTNHLRAKILKDLNERVNYRSKAPKVNDVAGEVNLELRFFTLDLTVDKPYKDMKHPNFWI